MKVLETTVKTILVETGYSKCNGDIPNQCAIHNRREPHIWFAQSEIETSEVVERPATIELIIEFLTYQERSDYWELRKKFPDYENKDWNWFVYMKRWLLEATDTKADPVSVYCIGDSCRASDMPPYHCPEHCKCN